MSGTEKVDIVFAVLASSKYRGWWWANYSTQTKQAELRALWTPVAAKLTKREIREGLARWQAERSETDPPTPGAFAAFLAPVHTVASRAGFAGIREILGAVDG